MNAQYYYSVNLLAISYKKKVRLPAYEQQDLQRNCVVLYSKEEHCNGYINLNLHVRIHEEKQYRCAKIAYYEKQLTTQTLEPSYLNA